MRIPVLVNSADIKKDEELLYRREHADKTEKKKVPKALVHKEKKSSNQQGDGDEKHGKAKRARTE